MRDCAAALRTAFVGLSVSLPGLERCLRDYCAPGAHQKQAFDLKGVPVAQQPISVLETKEKPPVAEVPVKKEEKPKGSLVDQYAEKLRQVRSHAMAMKH